MSAMNLIALASTVSVLAGGGAPGWLALPDQLRALDVLANNWIIAAAVGALAEFFADKVAWVDSAWDAVHSVIRPASGALLSMAIIDGSDLAWQVGSFLLGGGAALLAHAGKGRLANSDKREPWASFEYRRFNLRRSGDCWAARLCYQQPRCCGADRTFSRDAFAVVGVCCQASPQTIDVPSTIAMNRSAPATG